MKSCAPKKEIDERLGEIKILKTFSRIKDKQLVGGKVTDGFISKRAEVIIERNGEEIGRGKVEELQEQRSKVDKSEKGAECGMMINAKINIAVGDIITSFKKTIA